MDRLNLLLIFCVVLGFGLLTAPGTKEAHSYGASDVTDTEIGNATEDAPALTSLPAEEQQIIDKMINDSFDVVIYHFHPYGIHFSISQVDGRWQFGSPSWHGTLGVDLISHEDRIYHILIMGYTDGQVNVVPFWISGGLFLLGGIGVYVRRVR